jgi:hypothetical protein
VPKAAKADVHYRDGNPRRHCALCTMFRPPDGCTAVLGPIRPQDLCDLFKRSRRANPQGDSLPSKSASQARLMAAAAHTPGGYGGVPQSVGKEFNEADTGKKRSKLPKRVGKLQKSGMISDRQRMKHW